MISLMESRPQFTYYDAIFAAPSRVGIIAQVYHYRGVQRAEGLDCSLSIVRQEFTVDDH